MKTSQWPMGLTGAGFIGLLPAVPLDAAIIVTDVAAASQVVTGARDFDVDGDGFREWQWRRTSSVYMYTSMPGTISDFRVGARNVAWGVGFKAAGGTGNFPFGYPNRLASGDPISGGFRFINNSAQFTNSGARGQWLNDASAAYVGFQFRRAGQVHYGWVELAITDAKPGPNELKVLRYAYNDVPNETLLAGETSPAVPVTMTRFAAFAKTYGARLEWATAMELNNAGFAVERSGDGERWTEVGYVLPKGDGLTEQVYAFDDRDSRHLSRAYYRLRQEDFDGTVSYSEVQHVAIGLSPKPVLAPNVATSGAGVTLRNVDPDVAYVLFDARGATVATGRGQSVATDALAAGVYYLQVDGEHLELTIVE